MYESKINYLEKRISSLINFSDAFQSLPESSMKDVFSQDSQVKLQKLLKLGATADDLNIAKYISLDDLTQTKLNFLSNQITQLQTPYSLSSLDLINDRKIKLAYYFYNALSPRQKRRLTISPLNSGDFTPIKMHINPENVNITKSKRRAEQNVMDGIIYQDLGYKPRVLTIKGTTGSLFYEGIERLNSVYLTQKARIVKITFGGMESDIIGNKKDFEIKAVWNDFNCSVDNDSFMFKYDLSFIELKEQNQTSVSDTFTMLDDIITNFNMAKQISQKTIINVNSMPTISDYVPVTHEDMYMYYLYKAGTDFLKNTANTGYSPGTSTGISTTGFNLAQDIITVASPEIKRLRTVYGLTYTDNQIDESVGYVANCMEILYKNLSPIEFGALDLDTMYNNLYSEHVTRVEQYGTYYKLSPFITINSATVSVSSLLKTVIDRTLSYGIKIIENYKYFEDISDRFFQKYYSIYADKQSNVDNINLDDIYNTYLNLTQDSLYSGSDEGYYNSDESILYIPRISYIKKTIINLLSELDKLVRYEHDDLSSYVIRNFSKLIESLSLGIVINGANSTEQYNLRNRLRRDAVLRHNVDEFVFIIVWFYTLELYNNNDTVNGKYKY